MLNYSFNSLTCISFLGCCEEFSYSSDNLQNSVLGSYTMHSTLKVNRHRTYISNDGKNTIAFDNGWKVRNYFIFFLLYFGNF